jgi:selenide,water dikinase
MNGSQVPVLKDLVLVGGGHSHVIVLKRLGMKPMPGVRVTVIARDVDTPYSGMLPGLIAGHYQVDDVHVDLGRLSMFAGARFYHDEAVGLDLVNRRVICRHRPPVSYDVVSIDIGGIPVQRVEGAADHAVLIKPITALVSRWERLRARVRQQGGGLRIGVVGAGAAGIELTLAIQHALQELSSSAGYHGEVPDFHLFSSTETVLPTHGRLVQVKFRRVLEERGVHVHLGYRVVEVYPDGLETEDGGRHALDEIVWATEAGAQAWPRDAGLDVDDHGFIKVDDMLRSTSHHEVFAAGDTAAMVNYPREKAGVFAVRQGPPLEANLRRALYGQPLKPFSPQRAFLSLITTGDRYAVASRGGWAIGGRWVWQWKDWIDRRFMRQFSDLSDMDVTSAVSHLDLSQLVAPDVVGALSPAARRCGGCGSKVGATVLGRVISRLKPVRREDVIVGLEASDDASVEQVPAGMVAVRTVDVFRSIVDDPYMFGRITVHHCLGDIYAMGAEPSTALAIATVPVALEEKMEQLLEELLTGAVEVLNEAGVALVGGHTKEGFEMEFGLALSGIADPSRLLRKSGMRPGDRLILTKPIGTGTLFAAHMRLRAKGRWIDEALRSMTQSSLEASDCVRRHGATACTDVTGFGLVGHLLEMTRASRVDAKLSLLSIPLLAGAVETARAGFLSSLQPQNIRFRRAVANHADVRAASAYPLLFDPQTAGGLLVSIPAEQVESCLTELRTYGSPDAAEIGVISLQSNPDAPITVDV